MVMFGITKLLPVSAFQIKFKCFYIDFQTILITLNRGFLTFGKPCIYMLFGQNKYEELITSYLQVDFEPGMYSI